MNKLPHGKQSGLTKRLSRRDDYGKLNGNATATHCKHGHEFNDTNTKWSRRENGNWRRSCRKCAAIRAVKYKNLKLYSFAGLTSQAKARAAFDYWVGYMKGKEIDIYDYQALDFDDAYRICEVDLTNYKYDFNGRLKMIGDENVEEI